MAIALAFLLLLGGGGKIEWQRGEKEAPLEKALQEAKDSRRIVMVYFTADWCKFCTKLDAGAFSDDEVVKQSERFHRALVDCTDKEFFREMTKKYGLSGLPTLAFFDGEGKKIDEISGFLPESRPYLERMKKVGGAGVAPAVQDPPSDEDRLEKVLLRIEKELEESESRLRRDIQGIVRAAFEKGSKPKSVDEEVDAFAENLLEDQDIHSRLKEFLKTPRGKEFIRTQLKEQGIETLEQAIEMFFEKGEDGKYSLLPGYDEQLRAVLDQLEKPEEPKPKGRPYLGITPDDFSDDQRQALGLDKGHGVKILAVSPGGPADRSGVRPGDILLSLGKKNLGDENLGEILAGFKPGERVELLLLRENQKLKLEVTLGEK